MAAALPRVALYTRRACYVLLGLSVVAKVARDAGAPASLLTAALLLAALAAIAAVALRRHAPRWLDGWRLVLVLAGLWFLPDVYPRLGGDGIQYFVILRSPVLDGDLDFANDLLPFGTGKRVSIAPGVARGYPIGLPLLWAPPFVATHAAVSLARLFGAPVANDGFSQAYHSALTVSSYLYGFLALLLIERPLRRRFGPAVALLAVLGIWLATPLHFYMVANPFMSHAGSAFMATLFLLAWLRARDEATAWNWFLAGAAGAWLALIRAQDAVLLLPPGLDLLVRAGRARWRLAAAYAAAPVALALVQALLWLRMFGLAFVAEVSGQAYIGRTPPHVLDLLFAARHGLFIWTPLYLAAALGLLLYLRRQPWLGSLLLAGCAMSVLVNGAMQDWWGSNSFGQRRLLGLTPVFALGVAEAIGLVRRRPLVLAGGVLALLAVWNAQLAAIYNSAELADRNHAISLEKLAPAQVNRAFRAVLALEGRLPRRVFFFLYDNLKGVWLDEGARSLEGRVDVGAEPRDAPGLLGGGWYDAESEGETTLRRSRGRRSELRVPIRTPGDFRAVLRVRPELERPVGLTLFVNGEPLGAAALAPGWNEPVFAIPAHLIRPGLNTLTLAYSTTPREAIPGYHGRNAAIAVDWIRFERQESVTTGPR